MADIIDFPQDPNPQSSESDASEDTFLRDEGLELLAYYRAIKETAVRASILTLLQSLSRSRLSLPED